MTHTDTSAGSGCAAHRSRAGGDVRQIVLGIESSCDETAVALVSSERQILSERIASQDADHAPYGGVVPEIAARAHAIKL
ncbi:MAG: hypothetical protein AAF707_08920, partial [Pseudomonadota bacterium]